MPTMKQPAKAPKYRSKTPHELVKTNWLHVQDMEAMQMNTHLFVCRFWGLCGRTKRQQQVRRTRIQWVNVTKILHLAFEISYQSRFFLDYLMYSSFRLCRVQFYSCNPCFHGRHSSAAISGRMSIPSAILKVLTLSTNHIPLFNV